MLFDLHVHTKESSPCGQIEGKDLPALYKERGYDGIVITDHFFKKGMSEDIYNVSFEEYCELHKKGYEKAYEAGEKIGFKVLYGMELRLEATAVNDYLVFGISTDFIKENTDIFEWSVSQLKQASEDNGFVFYQAHPFRNSMTVVNPEFLYGIEVFNGKPYKNAIDAQRNDIANLWADKYSLHKIAGSDCHVPSQLATAGVKFMSQIDGCNDLLQALKSDSYYLVERASKSV